jgi:hypothetical protein
MKVCSMSDAARHRGDSVPADDDVGANCAVDEDCFGVANASVPGAPAGY